MDSTRRFWFAAILLVLAASASGERVSVTSGEAERRGASRAPSISADGRFVVFESLARLVPQDKNKVTDVYLRDRRKRTTRLISDSLGGDQPVISANGRFVAYRSFEVYENLPRIRVVDLEQQGPSISGAVQHASSYYQPADSPLLSANGRFLAFAFRPAPNDPPPHQRDHEVTVIDIVTRDRFPIFSGSVDNTGLADLGRFAMDADATRFVFETKLALTGDDTNGESDIYLASRTTPGQFTRLSRPAIGLPDLGGARDPVISLSGGRVFFIAENPLSAGDEDERATIYSVNLVGGISAPLPIATRFQPVQLARQATISGRYLGYLAKPPGSPARAFVINVETGVQAALAGDADGAADAPVLSGDDHVAVFSSAAPNVIAGDGNGSADVFAVVPKGAPAARSAPQVTLTSPVNEATLIEDGSFTVSANGTDISGIIRDTRLEIDGIEVRRAIGSVLSTNYAAPEPGLFSVRARSFNDAWIEGISVPSQVVVRRAGGSVQLAGIEKLERKDAEDGSAAFNATLRLTNYSVSESSALRLLVTAASTPFALDGGGELDIVPARDEQTLAFLDVPPIAPGASVSVSVKGITPATELIENYEQGVGWTVLGRVRTAAGLQLDSRTLFRTVPRLDENTFAPNGGVPNIGQPNTNGAFNPATLQTLEIQGRAQVAEGNAASYAAMAMFDAGSAPCAAQWSVQGPAGVATISQAGVLRSGNVTAPTVVKVRASFAGRTATRNVKIKPVTPKVTVRAIEPTAEEAGVAGKFKVMRSGPRNADLAVQYEIYGKAVAGSDYVALPGTATIPKGASSITVDVIPNQDASAEGIEGVTLTLLPDADYRHGSNRSATVRIVDDELPQAGQPDAILRMGNKAPIGEGVYDHDYGPGSDYETTQVIEERGAKNKPKRFVLEVLNPDTVARNYTVQGALGALGFDTRYFAGDEDVTAQVTAGEYSILQLAPGAFTELQVEITPTPAAAVGTSLRCDLLITSSTGSTDVVRAIVKRVK